jgi:hypothetical protein
MLRMLVPPSGLIRLKSTVSSLPFELHGTLFCRLHPCELRRRHVPAPWCQFALAVRLIADDRHECSQKHSVRSAVSTVGHFVRQPLAGCALAEEVGGFLLAAILRQMFHIGASG